MHAARFARLRATTTAAAAAPNRRLEITKAFGLNPVRQHRMGNVATTPAAAGGAGGSTGGGAAYPHGLTCLSPATSLDAIKARLGDRFDQAPLEEGSSPYVRPFSITYELDGKARRWDAVAAHDSVGVVLYHRERDAFLLVRQFRPAVYAARRRAAAAAGAPVPPLDDGFTIELCAGLADKEGAALEQVAAEEVAEETGFAVDAAQVKRISCAVASAGTTGALHHLFYAAVADGKRAGGGGGLAGHGEAIEVLALPFASVPAFVTDSAVPKSAGLMFGLLWAHGALGSGALRGKKGSMDTGTLVLQPVAPS